MLVERVLRRGSFKPTKQSSNLDETVNKLSFPVEVPVQSVQDSSQFDFLHNSNDFERQQSNFERRVNDGNAADTQMYTSNSDTSVLSIDENSSNLEKSTSSDINFADTQMNTSNSDTFVSSIDESLTHDSDSDSIVHECLNDPSLFRGNHVKEGLSIYYTNADNLLNKFDELLTRVQLDSPDILIITEVFPKTGKATDISPVELKIKGYAQYFSEVKEHSRGVLIYGAVSGKRGLIDIFKKM